MARRIQSFSYPFPIGGLFVMCSDGIGTTWSLDRCPGLIGAHPSLVAGVVYRDVARGRDRAAALTHRLLAFPRRQPLDPRPTNANALIVGMTDLLRRMINESIELRIVTADDLWLTLCDPHQLENAILNLAINKRDAMPAGGMLTIDAHNGQLQDHVDPTSRHDSADYVCICVKDTGMGMTPDVMARAFDPFFTTKPLGQGTGLGLSMIYGFARQSEGHARIGSEVGQGTSASSISQATTGMRTTRPAR